MSPLENCLGSNNALFGPNFLILTHISWLNVEKNDSYYVFLQWNTHFKQSNIFFTNYFYNKVRVLLCLISNSLPKLWIHVFETPSVVII